MGNHFQRTEHEFSEQNEKSFFVMKDLWIEIAKGEIISNLDVWHDSISGLLNPFQKHEPRSIYTYAFIYIYIYAHSSRLMCLVAYKSVKGTFISSLDTKAQKAVRQWFPLTNQQFSVFK